MKKLYFTKDFSAENVAKLQGEGFTLRDIRAYKESDFVEICDEAHGEVPNAYADKKAAEEANIDDLTVEQLKELLSIDGIEFEPKANKAELVALAKGK